MSVPGPRPYSQPEPAHQVAYTLLLLWVAELALYLDDLGACGLAVRLRRPTPDTLAQLLRGQPL